MAKIKSRNFMSIHRIMAIIKDHIEQKQPLSLVRLGDGENICLAQKKVWPLKEVLATSWARKSRKTNEKGVRLPNIKLRNRLIKAIKRADIVGIPHKEEIEIRTKDKFLRPLTEKCFKVYGIHPKRVCHTFVNRHLPEKREFWEMIRGKKVIVISSWAKKFKKYVRRTYPDFAITIVPVHFESYKQIKPVLKYVENIEADLALVSAGVNALILVDQLANKQNRVAIDFGKAPMFITKKDEKICPWTPQ